MKKFKLFMFAFVAFLVVGVMNVQAAATYKTAASLAALLGGATTEHASFEEAVTGTTDSAILVSGGVTDECAITGDLGLIVNKAIIIDTVTCTLTTELNINSAATVFLAGGAKVVVTGEGSISYGEKFAIGAANTNQLQTSVEGSSVAVSLLKSDRTYFVLTDLATINKDTEISTQYEINGTVSLNSELGLFYKDILTINENAQLRLDENAYLDVRGRNGADPHKAKLVVNGTLTINEGAILTNGWDTVIGENGVINNYGNFENASYTKTNTLEGYGNLKILGTINNYNEMLIESDTSNHGNLTGSTGVINNNGIVVFINIAVPTTLTINNSLGAQVTNDTGTPIKVNYEFASEEFVPSEDQVVASFADDEENPIAAITGVFDFTPVAAPSLSVTKINEGDAYNSLIKLKTSDQTVLATYDVVLANGTPDGDFLLTFLIGEKYVGKTLTILHLKTGATTPDKYTAVVDDEGLVTIKVSSLSPFMILATTTVNPKTDDGIMTSVILGSISILGLLGATMYLNKKKVLN